MFLFMNIGKPHTATTYEQIGKSGSLLPVCRTCFGMGFPTSLALSPSHRIWDPLLVLESWTESPELYFPGRQLNVYSGYFHVNGLRIIFLINNRHATRISLEACLKLITCEGFCSSLHHTSGTTYMYLAHENSIWIAYPSPQFPLSHFQTLYFWCATPWQEDYRHPV